MNPWLYLLSTIVLTLAISHHSSLLVRVDQKSDGSHEERSQDTRSARHMLPLVNRPCED